MSIKSYLTFLSRHKAYTLINVFGLSVSLMFVMIIALYYHRESSVDRHIPQRHRIVGVHANGWMGTSREIVKLLRPGMPQIEGSCALLKTDANHLSYADGMALRASALYADSCYLQFFHREMLEGDAATALQSKDAAVLSDVMASRLFPAGDAVGKTVELNRHKNLIISGVYRTDPLTSLSQADVVCNFELLREQNPWLFEINGNYGNSEVFLRLVEGSDLAQAQAQADTLLRGFYTQGVWGQAMGDIHFELTPFGELYNSKTNSYVCGRGKPALTLIITLMGLAVLFFSLTNYVNLTVAQAGSRAREMATRRLLGSHKRQVVLRLIGESVLLCVASVVLAVDLLLAALPWACQMLETELRAETLFRPANLALLLGLTLALGVVSGIIPARVIGSVNPIDVVRGTFRLKTKTTLSHIFMGVQHFITICLVACTGILTGQTRHMLATDLGFATDSLLSVGVVADAQKAMLMKKLLLQEPSVARATVCSESPLGAGDNQLGEGPGGTTVRFQRFYGDTDYLATMGLGLQQQWPGVEGYRDHQQGLLAYVGANFHSTFGVEPGTTHFRWRPDMPELMPIDGVLRPYGIGGLRNNRVNEIAILYVPRRDEDYPAQAAHTIVVRAAGEKEATLAAVKKVYREVYHEEMEEPRPWLSQQLREEFAQEIRAGQILGAFAVVAMVISILGLVAMSTYHIRQRRKETAVRKVFGSSMAMVRRRLVRQFLSHVLLAAVPALPCVWWATGKLLAGQQERAVWWPWIPVAVLLVLLVSYLAVSLQSARAAAESPIRQLRDAE